MSNPAQKFSGRALTLSGLGDSESFGAALARSIDKAVLAYDLDEDARFVALEMVKMGWQLSELQEQALATLVIALFVAMKNGSTRLPLDESESRTLSKVASLMAAKELHSAKRTLKAARGLAESSADAGPTGDGTPPSPLVARHNSIFAERYYALERQMVARLNERAQGEARFERSRVLEETTQLNAAGSQTFPLSDEQMGACVSALAGATALITGGPGTGKTLVVASIIRLAMRLGIDAKEIVLMAPTGKAAKRMSDSIARTRSSNEDSEEAAVQAQTIHRALGYSPKFERFRINRQNPLKAKVIVVDEASMIGLELMSRVLDACPNQSCLVLLGDVNQLPSVQRGAAFRDLVEIAPTKALSLTWLKQSFRSDPKDPAGAMILSVAKSVEEGGGLSLGAKATKPSELKYEGVELLTLPGDNLDPFLEHWADKSIQLVLETSAKVFRPDASHLVKGESGDFLDRVSAKHAARRILCATHRLPWGSADINARIGAYLSKRSPGTPLTGLPIVMNRNDYTRQLYNGDPGILVRCVFPTHGESLAYAFPASTGSWRLIQKDNLAESVMPAMALTVHKSQGSEFESVAFVMGSSQQGIVTRELLYTGITRARRSVVLVSSLDRIEAAIDHRNHRFSGLSLAALSPD